MVNDLLQDASKVRSVGREAGLSAGFHVFGEGLSYRSKSWESLGASKVPGSRRADRQPQGATRRCVGCGLSENRYYKNPDDSEDWLLLLDC